MLTNDKARLLGSAAWAEGLKNGVSRVSEEIRGRNKKLVTHRIKKEKVKIKKIVTLSGCFSYPATAETALYLPPITDLLIPSHYFDFITTERLVLFETFDQQSNKEIWFHHQ